MITKRAGTISTLEIREGWFGEGSPRIYLDPTTLAGGKTNKEIFTTMVNYLFSSFTSKQERWWKTVLDKDRAKEAYENNSNGKSFKPNIYKNHLRHNLEVLENMSLLELIEKHTEKTQSLLRILKDHVSSIDDDDDEDEVEKETNIRRLLQQITLKSIDDSLRPALNLPKKDLSEEETDELWSKIDTNKKLLEVLLYNINKKRGTRWEAGPGYSDFDSIDIVDQIGQSTSGDFSTKQKKLKKSRFRLQMDGKIPYYHLIVKLDFGKYFNEILNEGNILYTSQNLKDSKTTSFKEELPYAVFNIDNIIDWQKQFLNDDGAIDKKYINKDSKSQNPPLPPEFNLSLFLQTNSPVAERIKEHIRPDVWSEVVLDIKCEIGYDKKINRKGDVITGNPTMTKFIIKDCTINNTNMIKPQQWGYQSNKKVDLKSNYKFTSRSKRGVGGKDYRQGSWSDVANPKVASILHSIRRNYDIIKELIQ